MRKTAGFDGTGKGANFATGCQTICRKNVRVSLSHPQGCPDKGSKGKRDYRQSALFHASLLAAWSLTLRVDLNRLVWPMGHGTKKLILRSTGITSKGLKRIYGRFWSTSAGISWSRRERILPWASNTRKAIPCWFRPLLPSSPPKTEAPYSHKTLLVKVLVKVGAIKKESLKIPCSYLERETGFEGLQAESVN
jgi:hypothetical protein